MPDEMPVDSGKTADAGDPGEAGGAMSSWILPTHVPPVPLTGVRTHLLDKPLKRLQKREVRKPHAVKIRGRVYKSVSAAARQFKRHHSVIEGWIRTGKAVLV